MSEPTASQIKLVVLDLAGTTVQDNGEVIGAFTEALSEHRIVATPDQLRGIRGASKRQALHQLLPEGPDRQRRAESIYASFRRLVERKYKTKGVQAVPGALDVIGRLREEGISVALNTGFDREIAALLLDALGWLQIADTVVCADDVSRGRPAPYMIFRAMECTGIASVHQVVHVGDTALDLEAGYNAGVFWNAGVLSGAHDRATLERAPHTHIWNDVTDLLPALRKSAFY